MTNESKAISVVLPMALYEKLAALAESNHRSISDQVRFFIDEAPAPRK